MKLESFYYKFIFKNLLKVIFGIFVFTFIFYFLVNFSSTKINSLRPKVAVTIFPFYDLVKEIAGDSFEVILISPPGAEPHNFEPSLSMIKNIKGTKIIFASGLDIDNWSLNIKNIFPEVKIVYFAPYVELLKIEDEIDPHFWLSLNNFKKMAEVVKNELENLNPENKEKYETNYQNVLRKIQRLENLIYLVRSEIKFPYLITQHSAFNYLAKELRLIVLASLEGAHKELTIKDLKDIINNIKGKKIKAIFKEPGEESQLVENLAKELNLEVYELDPIEGKSGLDYFSAYRKNLETLSSALK
jgi:zinc transport system substrate-binding protein